MKLQPGLGRNISRTYKNWETHPVVDVFAVKAREHFEAERP